MNDLDQRLDSLARADHAQPPAAFLSAVARRRTQRRAKAATAAAGLLLIALAVIIVQAPTPDSPPQIALVEAPIVGPRHYPTNLGRAGTAIPVGLRLDPNAVVDLAGSI